jgi:3-methyladenine DNA glycosylase Mpg
VPAPQTPTPAAPAAVEPPKKKRGRSPNAVAASDEAPAASDGFVLYIGCAPIGTKVTNALVYVNAAHDEVRKAHSVAHHREMEYGKGPGELCKALEILLALCEGTENVPSGDVFLGNTQIEEDTAPVWIAKAAKVVRAFR